MPITIIADPFLKNTRWQEFWNTFLMAADQLHRMSRKDCVPHNSQRTSEKTNRKQEKHTKVFIFSSSWQEPTTTKASTITSSQNILKQTRLSVSVFVCGLMKWRRLRTLTALHEKSDNNFWRVPLNVVKPRKMKKGEHKMQELVFNTTNCMLVDFIDELEAWARNFFSAQAFIDNSNMSKPAPLRESTSQTQREKSTKANRFETPANWKKISWWQARCIYRWTQWIRKTLPQTQKKTNHFLITTKIQHITRTKELRL